MQCFRCDYLLSSKHFSPKITWGTQITLMNVILMTTTVCVMYVLFLFASISPSSHSSVLKAGIIIKASQKSNVNEESICQISENVPSAGLSDCVLTAFERVTLERRLGAMSRANSSSFGTSEGVRAPLATTSLDESFSLSASAGAL